MKIIEYPPSVVAAARTQDFPKNSNLKEKKGGWTAN
jgi:hypothetical protein